MNFGTKKKNKNRNKIRQLQGVQFVTYSFINDNVYVLSVKR